MKLLNRFKFKQKKIMLAIRYFIIAVLAYGIDFGGFVVLIHHGYDPVIANILVKVLAALFGFCGHRYFTYAIFDHSDISKHAVKYFGLAFIYTPVSTLFLYLMMLFWPNPIYAKLAVDIILYILTFSVTTLFVFTPSKKHMPIKTPRNS